jgi:DNA-binding response OmpR family regulator
MAEANAPGRPWPRDERRVLVVEDDRNIADVLVTALEDEGYTVRAAGDGRQALQVLRTWSPRVVLLDLMLPLLDGWSVLQQCQREGLAREARVVVVSASRNTPVIGSSEPPVAAVIPKPFDLTHVLATVASLLS